MNSNGKLNAIEQPASGGTLKDFVRLQTQLEAFHTGDNGMSLPQNVISTPRTRHILKRNYPPSRHVPRRRKLAGMTPAPAEAERNTSNVAANCRDKSLRSRIICTRTNFGLAIHNAGESSRTTHGAPSAIDACRYFAGLLLGALGGRSKEEILSPFFCPGPDRDYWQRRALSPAIAEVANGSFRQKEPPAIIGSGFVVRSVEAALWAFHRSDSFREGALRAVNLGNDADTTGAIYGQLAGAFYGVNGIPQDWLERLAMRELIAEKADALFDLSTAR
jgi:ADP-ribosylglycohydrolase